ncbi:hypothetical protein XENOCAPTIV_012665 [Xenoophorus captivus]|uniref:CCHC-type domain-containing protein n=1 Tax=Xenoophorus captivus TaxID=1517983 RepID=A0ABV0QAF3_9TELE
MEALGGRRQGRGRDDGRDYVCWACGQHGHWARNCPTGQPSQQRLDKGEQTVVKEGKGEVDENKEMIDIAAAYMDKLRSSQSTKVYVSLHEILITSPTGMFKDLSEYVKHLTNIIMKFFNR